jgi:ABC-type nitrate/sulfonate/bicarbonate transport system substrate-binding protein
MRAVDQLAPQKVSARAPSTESLLLHQVAADVGVDDQRIGRPVRVLATPVTRAALQAVRA